MAYIIVKQKRNKKLEYKGHTYKYINGDAFTPARFWERIYITQEEYDKLIFCKIYDKIPTEPGYDKRAQFRDKSQGYIKGKGAFMYFKEDFIPVTEEDKRYIDLAINHQLGDMPNGKSSYSISSQGREKG